MTVERPLEDVDRVATASWHIAKAIDFSESNVPVTIDRARAHAEIAQALLQLHEAEQIAAPPYIDALGDFTRNRERFALDVIERYLREQKLPVGQHAVVFLPIVEALKEAGRTV